MQDQFQMNFKRCHIEKSDGEWLWKFFWGNEILVRLYKMGGFKRGGQHFSDWEITVVNKKVYVQKIDNYP